MIGRIYGSIMLIAACAGIGYRKIHRRREEIRMLRQLRSFTERIAYSLQYYQYPLAQLLRGEENILTGDLLLIIRQFVRELESQVSPNVACCMNASIANYNHLSGDVKRVLMELGNSFGKFDMLSQLKYLEGTVLFCKKVLASLEDNLPGYTRCCQAYSLSIGIILALFLI